MTRTDRSLRSHRTTRPPPHFPTSSHTTRLHKSTHRNLCIHTMSANPFARLPTPSNIPSNVDPDEWIRRCTLSLGPSVVTPIVDDSNIFLLNPRSTKLPTFFCQFCGKQFSLFTLVAQHWTGNKRKCENLVYDPKSKSFRSTIVDLPTSPHKRAYRQVVSDQPAAIGTKSFPKNGQGQ